MRRSRAWLGGLLAIAALAGSALTVSALAARPPRPVGAYTTVGAAHFFSAPSLHPPKLITDAPTGKGLAPGYVMTDTEKNLALKARMIGQGGPLILDRRLQPVWIHPVPTNDLSLNLLAQTYQGKPVLTWWQGQVAPSNGPLFAKTGADMIVDHRYRTIAALHGRNGWVLSPHEFLLEGGDALVTAYKNVPGDLTAFGGPRRGVIIDTAVQEYNVSTGALVWQWDALQHVAPSETYAKVGRDGVFDPYHLNSIDPSMPGKLLISLRNTWAAYLIDRATGNIDWRLAGKKSDFELGPNAAFSWQHDAKFLPDGEITIFDDACCPASGPKANGPARGLFLRLDTAAHTATVARQYTHNGLKVGSQGSVQVLPNGNVMIGWGQQPWFSEYRADGKLLFDARYPNPDITYRAYVQTWTGTPFYPPSIAARRHAGKVFVYASWNGATNVASWQLLSGSSPRSLKVAVRRARRTGFETAIGVAGGSFFKVLALDAKGRAIGSSKVVRVSG